MLWPLPVSICPTWLIAKAWLTDWLLPATTWSLSLPTLVPGVNQFTSPFLRPLLWEGSCYQPNPRPSSPQIKVTHSACHFTACLSWHNCWTQMPHTWKEMPLTIYISISPSTLNVMACISWSLPTSLAPTCRGGCRP